MGGFWDTRMLNSQSDQLSTVAVKTGYNSVKSTSCQISTLFQDSFVQIPPFYALRALFFVSFYPSDPTCSSTIVFLAVEIERVRAE